jgi:hypothetical protein
MKKFFLFAGLIITITGCQKNTGPGDTGTALVLNGTFQTEKIVYLKPAVMFIQNTQITDLAIINSYLNRHGYSSYFSSSTTQTITDTSLIITFGNNDSVSFKSSAYPGLYYGTKTQTMPDEWVIQRSDTNKYFIDPYPAAQSRCDTLHSKVTKIKKILLYQVLPGGWGGTGYYALVSDVFRFPLQAVNNQLQFPRITVATNTVWNYPSSNGNCKMLLSDMWNIKNDNIENNLLPGDTIVIQEKNIKMNKMF